MKYLADTHMHSIYSYDGQMTLEKMVERGMELKLKYMSFTEHLEFHQITMKQFLNRYTLYKEEIDRLQEKYPEIILLKGVEFSNPEQYPNQLEQLQNLDLDYIIGSNHQLPITGSKKEIYKYYLTILKMVQLGGFDALGHMDYVRRKFDDDGVSFDIIKEIYKCLLRNGGVIELNSSAIRRTGLDCFPGDNKIKLYEKLGGEKVTIGSDAHRINEIYDGIEQIDQQYHLNKGVYIKRKFIPIVK